MTLYWSDAALVRRSTGLAFRFEFCFREVISVISFDSTLLSVCRVQYHSTNQSHWLFKGGLFTSRLSSSLHSSPHLSSPPIPSSPLLSSTPPLLSSGLGNWQDQTRASSSDKQRSSLSTNTNLTRYNTVLCLKQLQIFEILHALPSNNYKALNI